MARVFQGLFIRRMIPKNKKKPRRTLYRGTYTKRINTPSYSYYSKRKLAPANKKKIIVKKKRR